MLDSLVERRAEILFAVVAGNILATAWLEVFWQRRRFTVPRWRRWATNLSFATINGLTFRLAAVPVTAAAAAVFAAEHGWGVFRLVAAPDWLAVALGILLLDMSAYGIHRLEHAVPLLWRLHRVHHSDLEIDFTTTLRHHPFDALVGAVLTSSLIVIFGVPPVSVILHQVMIALIEFPSHANIRLPRRLDEWLRLAIVTPGMHVVHHSTAKRETDSNFAAGLSVWDRLFGTYVAAPASDVTEMTIGLEYWRVPSDQRIDRVLLSPFLNPAASAAPSSAVSAAAMN